MRSAQPSPALVAIALLGVLALVLDWRGRIAVALVTAITLGLLQRHGLPAHWRIPQSLQRLGQASYSVFLVHFPVCMLVAAAWSWWRPTQPGWNALGMLVAFALSLAAGCSMHRLEERLTHPRHALGLRVLLLMAAGALLANAGTV